METVWSIEDLSPGEAEGPGFSVFLQAQGKEQWMKVATMATTQV